MTLLGLAFIIFGAIATFVVCGFYSRRKPPLLMGAVIYGWHTAICIGYYLYLRNDAVDATTYFHQAFYLQDFGLGTQFIKFVVSVIRATFETASVLDAFLLFNILGSLGLLLFYFTCRELTLDNPKMRWLVLLFVFLPGMSFWSCAIGKEPIMFFGIQAVLYALLNLNRRYAFLVVGLVLAFLVRPHIAGVLAGSIGIGFLFTSKKYRLIGTLSVMAIAVVLWVLTPMLLGYLRISALDAASITEFIDARQESLSSGGSQINIRSYNVFQKVFSYIYRPAIFEARSVSMLLAGVENTLFVGVTIWILVQIRRVPASHWLRLPHSAVLVFFVMGILTSAYVTGNLGLATRQKYQFMPAAFLLILGIRHYALLQKARRPRKGPARLTAPSPGLVSAQSRVRPPEPGPTGRW